MHGQYYDFYTILQKWHEPERNNAKLLFLGDYVDRGPYGPEIVLHILLLKLRYPDNIFLLRGNHESREMTEQFNFREQCLDLYDIDFYDEVMNTFDQMPICAVLNGLYICMHGGISRNVTSVDAINEVERRMEPPAEDCLMSDLLWADPARNRDMDIDYEFNELRGICVIFGKYPANKFLEENDLFSIIRAHECKHKGIKFHCWNGAEKFPPVVTVFSAPNYCGTKYNDGAVIVLEGGEAFDVKRFREQEKYPYRIPNVNPFMDVITYYHDYMMDCLKSVLYYIGKETVVQTLDYDEADEDDTPVRTYDEDEPLDKRINVCSNY